MMTKPQAIYWFKTSVVPQLRSLGTKHVYAVTKDAIQSSWELYLRGLKTAGHITPKEEKDWKDLYK